MNKTSTCWTILLLDAEVASRATWALTDGMVKVLVAAVSSSMQNADVFGYRAPDIIRKIDSQGACASHAHEPPVMPVSYLRVKVEYGRFNT